MHRYLDGPEGCLFLFSLLEGQAKITLQNQMPIHHFIYTCQRFKTKSKTMNIIE